MTPPPPTAKQQSTNVQRQTGDDGRMRWKTTAAEELRQMQKTTSWQWNSNVSMAPDKQLWLVAEERQQR
jgi:hypothetical protein